MTVVTVAAPAPTPSAVPAPAAAAARLAGLRLALIGPLAPPAGGMAAQTRQLADLLTAAGARVELVQTNHPYQPEWIGRLPVVRAGARLVPYLWRLWRAAGRNQLFHVMANSGWAWHLFAAPAIRIAALRGVPVVVNYRGGEAAGFLERSAASVRWSMASAAALIVPSAFLQRIFATHGMAAEVVPNIIDMRRFSPGAPRCGDDFHVVVARHLEKLYDNASALRGFSILRRSCPRARLTLAGSGPEEQPLKRLAGELGIGDAVCFAGSLDRMQMSALMREADAVLNPSLADNMPNSVLEALASGVPVVSTDVGGIPYIVRDGDTALLVPPGDADAMAAALLRLHREPALRRALRERGLVEVQRYTWDRVAPLLATVYTRAHSPR